MSPALGPWRCAATALISFQSGEASRVVLVSNVWGTSPGPGELATCVPAGTGTIAGKVPPSSIVKASNACAARPGPRS